MTRVALAALLLLMGGAGALCATTAPAATTRAADTQRAAALKRAADTRRAADLARAQRIRATNPSDANSLAVAEMERCAATRPVNYGGAAQQLFCWRLMAAGEVDTPRFRDCAPHHSSGADGWAFLLGLLAADAAGDDAQVLRAARAVATAPAAFPTVRAEQAHFAMLLRLGRTRSEAALEVITHRSYDALAALKRLDESLTSRAEAMRDDDPAAADALLAVRDRLRAGYIAASRNVVERLMALSLAGDAKGRDELLAAVRKVPWLTDGEALRRVLASMPESRSWPLVLKPLLENELAVVASPPDVAAAAAAPLEFSVRARASRAEGDGRTRYEGDVTVRIEGVTLTCDEATVTRDGDVLTLSAAGRVQAAGDAGTVAARRATFTSATQLLAFDGDVRLVVGKASTKLLSCDMTTAGDVCNRRSLLDDFDAAPDAAAKLAMLPRITAVYDDEELPGDVALMLAGDLLRPHLTWHRPIEAAAGPEANGTRFQYPQWYGDTSPWANAHSGEPWMLELMPAAQRQQIEASLAADGEAALKRAAQYQPSAASQPAGEGAKRLQEVAAPSAAPLYWRLAEPNHVDVARARLLLERVRSGMEGDRARRWLAELDRNNTAITMDVAGGYAPARAGRVVVDVRNADTLTLKLYRVADAQAMLAVASRIGGDFIFRDYAWAQPPGPADLLKRCQMQEVASRTAARELPELPAGTLVREWSVAVSDLRRMDDPCADEWWRDDWDCQDEESQYFGDACEEFSARLSKDYRQFDGPGAWQADRLLEIPADALREPGGYVLVAQANGQWAGAPIIVEPLSLTLRRCRDGVMVVASDAAGQSPAAGATVLHSGLRAGAQPPVTDAAGVAFARMFASGAEPVVVCRDGRFAIGGFGRVFEGLYVPRAAAGPAALQQAVELRMWPAADALVYADNYVVAGYTDRPTYRPGQEVNFKLIIRVLASATATTQPASQPAAPAASQPAAGEFRAEDFDLEPKLSLPQDGTDVSFELLDPAGRSAGRGSALLSKFGTLAGKLALGDEAATGLYSLRVQVGEVERIVPHLLAVKYYRRAGFGVTITPAAATQPATTQPATAPATAPAGTQPAASQPAEAMQVRPGQPAALSVAADYYFGKPVAAGKVELRLVRPEHPAALAVAAGELNAAGRCIVQFSVPADLPAGDYAVVATVADSSGRTAGATLACRCAGGAGAVGGASPLSLLPRFVAVGEPLAIATAQPVTAQGPGEPLRASAAGGVARLKLPACGWYTLACGDQNARIFAYGGKSPPPLFDALVQPAPGGAADGPRAAPQPQWINLTEYAGPDGDGLTGDLPACQSWDRTWDSPAWQLAALLDRQHASVGDKLRVLLYVPFAPARVLLTLEGETVVDYFAADLPEGDSYYRVVEVPIKRRHLPNFYLQGRILWGRGGGDQPLPQPAEAQKQATLDEAEDKPLGDDPLWCRVDVIDPSPAPVAPGLSVSVQPDTADCRPGQKLGVTIRATDAAGRPAAAELSLAAVDQSVFAFGEDGLGSLAASLARPHPARLFYPKRWRSYDSARYVAGADGEKKLAAALQQRLAAREMAMAMQQAAMARMANAAVAIAPANIDGAATAGRGSAPAPLASLGQMPVGMLPFARVRGDFRETACWLPRIVTDAAGAARAELTLPDSLTSWRLTAVGVAADARVGVGRAAVKASLPLSVQLVAPRFALEGDGLELVALVHNNTAGPRTFTLRWRLDMPGDKPTAQPAPVELEAAAGATVRHALPPVAFGAAGVATLAVEVAGGGDSDAERRELTVYPLGRPREFTAAGSFEGAYSVPVPAGFVPGDMMVTISRGDAAGAIDSLRYLVDYPYGCVEQTMSRFLPAVMVRHAVRQTGVPLPPDVQRKLPEVLHRGLARLAKFQHADGGWGWWETDATNDAMTVYVTYGLLRCRQAGAAVDDQMLAKACSYIANRLAGDADKLDDTASHGPLAGGLELRAQAHLVLAMAGRPACSDLEGWALNIADRRTLDGRTRCMLALACSQAGLDALGRMHWTKASDWQPTDTVGLAMKLQCQAAFGARADARQATAAALLNRRSGHQWENTRATSYAVEALADLLATAPAAKPAKTVRVELVTGQKRTTLLDAAGDDLAAMVHRVAVPAALLTAAQGATIELTADAGEAVNFAVTAAGHQRMEKFQGSGDAVRMTRQYTTLSGGKLPEASRVGDVLAVRVLVHLAAAQQYVMVEDRRPAGFEFADDRLFGAAAGKAANVEFRDDRVCAFFTSLPAGRHELVYYLRAETAGLSHVLPGRCGGMYTADFGETAADTLNVANSE
jgi:hypothetical protein